MFTGLINDLGTLISLNKEGEGARLRIACTYKMERLSLGASIACNGACLTVIDRGTVNDQTWFEIQASSETLAKTSLGALKQGDAINLETSLRLGDELGGHIVTGHIDGVATIISKDQEGAYARFVIEAPPQLSKFIAAKGSVALDGTSLTVNSVNGNSFTTMLIPHTLSVTNWGARKAGHHVNLEVDLMARYAARLLEAGQGAPIMVGATNAA